MIKNLPANAGDIRDASSVPGSGRSPGAGYGNPLQYSCLENPMDKGAWQATVHRAKVTTAFSGDGNDSVNSKLESTGRMPVSTG